MAGFGEIDPFTIQRMDWNGGSRFVEAMDKLW